jgi:sorbitol-specific phosphotransferase system component IIBC
MGRTETIHTRRFADPDPFEYLERIPAGLDELIAANAATEKRRRVYPDPRHELEAATMSQPISADKAYQYFGMLLGSLGPWAIVMKIMFDIERGTPEEFWFVSMFAVAAFVTSTTGFLTGKLVARALDSIKNNRWSSYISISALIGIAWGAFSGGIGGVFILVIGGFIGSAIGAIAAGLALPAFASFHRLLSRGGYIELKHFLPLALGIVLTMCAFILGA